MNTQISSKIAALAVALMMNSLILGGVAYLFNSQPHSHAVVMSLAQIVAPAGAQFA
ncbi:MAG TPA: hypothetical protein VN692_11420 [Steroidobacteraceae bacterium]|nr:hypothetical protein [Steroidobacteraceae bacterium]